MRSENESDLIMKKVELILESPTERSKYKSINTDTDQLAFFCNHFIMDDMSVRLIKRRYLLSRVHREEFLRKVEEMIFKMDL